MADPATTLAVCAWLRKRIEDWEDAAKAQLELVAGERKAAIVNGQVIGYVTECKGRRRTTVDDAALLEWVKIHNPTEIELSVRPAFRKKLVDEVTKIGALLDSDGLVSDAIQVVEGKPYPMCTVTEVADDVLRGILAHGRLTVDGLRDELPSIDTHKATDG